VLYGVPFKVGKDYLSYLERNLEHAGIWQGSACENFGLTPGTQITQEQFQAIRENRHPVTGKRLTARTNKTHQIWKIMKNRWVQKTESNRVVFYDFTCSAPKTFSILALPGGKKEVLEWHRKAVDKMLVEMESVTARIDRSKGANVLETTGRFAAARFSHDLNRSGEPGIHDHLLIVNATPADNGKNYAVMSSAWMERSRYLTQVYRDALAHEARKAGYAVTYDEHHAPQIAGIEDLISVYSGRSADVAALIEAAEEITGTVLDPNEVKKLVVCSRGLDLAEFRDKWRVRSTELKADALNHPDPKEQRASILSAFTHLVIDCSDGGTIESTTEAVIQAQREMLSPEDLARLENIPKMPPPVGNHDLMESVQYALDHLFERLSVVHDHKIYAEAVRHAAGTNVNLDLLKKLVDNHPRLIRKGDEFTTREHMDRETQINLWIQNGYGQGVRFQPVKDPQLSPDQLRAVNELLACPDQFSALIGRAGTGKSHALDGLVRVNIDKGYRAAVMAPSVKATDVLTHPDRCTLQMFLTNPHVRKHLRPMDLVILDEAGFCSVRQMYDLIKLVVKNGYRLCLVGDPRQHTSVEAGDSFRIILNTTGIKREWLEKIVRQHPNAMKGAYLKAAKLLSQAKVTEAFRVFDAAGALHELHGQGRINTLASRYVEEREAGKSVICVNSSHVENDAVNDAVRHLLKKNGLIGGEERVYAAHRTLGWTLAEKKQFGRLKPGYIIEITRGKDKGKAFEVRQVQCDRAFGVDEHGVRRQFDRGNVDAWDVCQRRDLPIAIGDDIIAHSGMKGRRGDIINGERFRIAGFTDSGPMSTTGKLIETRNLTHGYASTSHRSQGDTVDTVLFGLSRTSLKFATVKLAYVAATRGRFKIDIFAENKHELCGIQDRSGDRKSALELVIQRIKSRKTAKQTVQNERKVA
jgi:conjugative relaxase-like TrwC/TraI family protein